MKCLYWGYNEDGFAPLSTESGYVENGFSTNTEYRTTKWPGGGPSNLANKETGVSPVTEEGTYNMYCNREPRFYVSVIYNGAWLGVDNRRVNFLQGGRDTDMTFDSPQNVIMSVSESLWMYFPEMESMYISRVSYTEWLKRIWAMRKH